MSESKTTTDHETVRRWAEERGGRPATVLAAKTGGEAGILRIDFPDGEEEALEPIDWDEFFEKFDESNLAFLYLETTKDGKTSRFCKFVSRENA